MIFFCVPQVVANLMIVISLLYYLCDSSSMVCLTRTLQYGAVSFQACGWMFAGMDPIWQNNNLWMVRQSVCKHAPSSKMDNDGDFYVRVLVDYLLY